MARKWLKLQEMTSEIVVSSQDNTAGTLLDEDAIYKALVLLRILVIYGRLTKERIDTAIDLYQTESGYLVKAADFTHVLTKHN